MARGKISSWSNVGEGTWVARWRFDLDRERISGRCVVGGLGSNVAELVSDDVEAMEAVWVNIEYVVLEGPTLRPRCGGGFEGATARAEDLVRVFEGGFIGASDSRWNASIVGSEG